MITLMFKFILLSITQCQVKNFYISETYLSDWSYFYSNFTIISNKDDYQYGQGQLKKFELPQHTHIKIELNLLSLYKSYQITHYIIQIDEQLFDIFINNKEIQKIDILLEHKNNNLFIQIENILNKFWWLELELIFLTFSNYQTSEKTHDTVGVLNGWNRTQTAQYCKGINQTMQMFDEIMQKNFTLSYHQSVQIIILFLCQDICSLTIISDNNILKSQQKGSARSNCDILCDDYQIYSIESEIFSHQSNQLTLIINPNTLAYLVDIDIYLFTECQDINLTPFDGCFFGHYSCCIGCSNCIQGVCFECEDGYEYKLQTKQCIANCDQGYILVNNKCYPICGDQIVISEFEECDDGNRIQYDGCYNCQIQCTYGCSVCNPNGECTLCEQNYSLEKSICEMIQIDDSEEIEIVEQTYCSDNYELQNGICINLCGNSLLNLKYEECDDGNQIGGDGCSSNCNQEDSFYCINQEGQLSQCYFIQYPSFYLTNLSEKRSNVQIVQLSFNQEVYEIDEISIDTYSQIQISPYTLTDITMIAINTPKLSLANVEFQITVTFLNEVELPLLLFTFYQNNFLNKDNLLLSNLQSQISLGNPFVLSKSIQNKVELVIEFNNAMLYTTISITGLSLLFGNFQMFFNAVDILQQLSYLKFIKCGYPTHLQQFLEVFTKISLKPLMDLFNIDYYIQKFTGGLYKIKQQSNTQLISLSDIYLINSKSCFITFFISIVTFLICQILTSSIVRRKVYSKLLSKKISLSNLKILSKTIYGIQQQCLKLKHHFFYSGLLQMFQTIQHQLVFSTFVQLITFGFEGIYESFNTIVSILTLIFLIYIILYSFRVSKFQYLNNIKFQYYFEGINKNYWSLKIRACNLIRVIIYIGAIVLFQNHPSAQPFILSILSMLYFACIISLKPFQQVFEFYKSAIKECLLFLITGSFWAYSFDLNNNQLMIFGWIHIGLISLILVNNLIIDLIKSIINICQRFQKSKMKQQQLKKLHQIPNLLQTSIIIDTQMMKVIKSNQIQ